MNREHSPRQYNVNQTCIIGLPACGYGFESSRLCFLARPADSNFQLEHDILERILMDRNYQLYAALQNLDPGSFAFCTKICSKVITCHFCVVLLNQSSHSSSSSMKIPNPNVHFEYGMMLSFHKHVIPMQREEEILPFKIYPLDTVKYRPENFKSKAEAAIDDAILRYTTKEPPGRPVGAISDVIKFFAFRGMRYTDTNAPDAAAIFRLGNNYGFSLFDGPQKIVFFGYFHQEETIDIVVNTRFLIDNIHMSYQRLENPVPSPGSTAVAPEQREYAIKLLDQIAILLLVPEEAPISTMQERIQEHMAATQAVPIEILRPSDLTQTVQQEYAKVLIP